MDRKRPRTINPVMAAAINIGSNLISHPQWSTPASKPNVRLGSGSTPTS